MDASRCGRSNFFAIRYFLPLLACSTVSAAETAGPRPDAAAIARRIDAAFAKAMPEAAKSTAIVDDTTFVRRACLDLTGKLPDLDVIQQFVLDTTPDKRAKLVDQCLQNEAYSVHWARYWRDVLTYHTPASSNYLRWELFNRWWVDQIARNRPWNEIVTELVTATGVNDETATVNYLTALYGNPVEIAATTSRVFLGVQIQCAECHDAKSEPWKREQFHEFAAFFGRAKLIQHKDVDGRGTPYAIEGRADGQYQMSDKKKPDRLIAMQPRFFTGEAVAIDAPDEVRRQALARFLTDSKNPWFARCYVNRIWTALMGWGFYPSVNDLGSPEMCRHSELLDLIAKEWIATGYDMRWLFRTIALTEVYQRQLTEPLNSEEIPPSVCPVRLRAEQVFEALQMTLGFSENDTSVSSAAPSSAPALQRHTGLRNMIYQAFKENPSSPAQEVQGTIPQALLMMNSELVQKYTSAKGKTILAELFERKLPDDQMIVALYERVLARKPSFEEQKTCSRYLANIENREEAYEDLLWSLVNSTEFLIKK